MRSYRSNEVVKLAVYGAQGREVPPWKEAGHLDLKFGQKSEKRQWHSHLSDLICAGGAAIANPSKRRSRYM